MVLVKLSLVGCLHYRWSVHWPSSWHCTTLLHLVTLYCGGSRKGAWDAPSKIDWLWFSHIIAAFTSLLLSLWNFSHRNSYIVIRAPSLCKPLRWQALLHNGWILHTSPTPPPQKKRVLDLFLLHNLLEAFKIKSCTILRCSHKFVRLFQTITKAMIVKDSNGSTNLHHQPQKDYRAEQKGCTIMTQQHFDKTPTQLHLDKSWLDMLTLCRYNHLGKVQPVNTSAFQTIGGFVLHMKARHNNDDVKRQSKHFVTKHIEVQHQF